MLFKAVLVLEAHRVVIDYEIDDAEWNAMNAIEKEVHRDSLVDQARCDYIDCYCVSADDPAYDKIEE